jgi:hypothetical protein
VTNQSLLHIVAMSTLIFFAATQLLQTNLFLHLILEPLSHQNDLTNQFTLFLLEPPICQMLTTNQLTLFNTGATESPKVYYKTTYL